ncbi:hypothetical protein SB748_25625 [Rhizobium sp. SIMBA_035]
MEDPVVGEQLVGCLYLAFGDACDDDPGSLRDEHSGRWTSDLDVDDLSKKFLQA